MEGYNMKKVRGTVAFLLVFVLSFSVIPQNVLAAKKKVKLSKKSVTVTVGKTVKVKLKNNKKKVKWTVTSGKKNVKLSKKKKTGVTIHGKKAGKAKVQAKVGKKKFVCKVTVKKAGTNQNADKNNGKKTAEPTVKPPKNQFCHRLRRQSRPKNRLCRRLRHQSRTISRIRRRLRR